MEKQENGLCNFIKHNTDGKADVYLNKDGVSVHWDGASKEHIQHLKLLIANYIGCKMLMDSYKTINFYY